MYAQQYFVRPINVVLFILLLTLISRNHAEEDYAEYYSVCKRNSSASCGNLITGYPFWGNGIRPEYCGVLEYEISCEDSELYTNIGFGTGSKYRITFIKPETNTLELERPNDIVEDICNISSINSTILNDKVFGYSVDAEDYYFYYNCPTNIYTTYVGNNFTCPFGYTNRNVVFGNQRDFEAQGANHLLCDKVTVPAKKIVTEIYPEDVVKQLQQLLQRRFEVHYSIDKKDCSNCMKNYWLCWCDTNLPKSKTCLSENGVQYIDEGKNKHLGLKLGTVSGAAGATIVILLLILYSSYCHRNSGQDSSLFPRHVSSYPKDVEAFLRQYGSSTPKRFRYATLKNITNSFKDELGKGGYGSVYKGCLSDGRVVAVKVLNETKGNGEEFLNEVASIGRTSHVNVVKLLGFCYEGKKRALIYDYMPNGSLEKFIYGKLPSTEGQHLGWEKLYSVALGIARGLEYLHRGCNTRILHFDIKPQNILLDEDFRPKISDFGLAKLYNEKESIISSIIQARGTIGYIAPEVFSRNFGQVSQKSDVYSYGMMILEMIGGRKNVHAEADQTSEIYYPHWVYKRIAFNEDLCFGSEMSEEEIEIARKMVIVGLWCIQTNPMQRPYISKVIEMLEGQIASLEMPPKPYLCSAPNSPSNSQ